MHERSVKERGQEGKFFFSSFQKAPVFKEHKRSDEEEEK